MGFDTRIGGLVIDGTTTRFLFHVVTGNLFTGLQLKPAAGRLFLPGEGEQVGAEHVIVLGYSYWRSRFGGNPDVINSVVRLNGTSAQIVGSRPKGLSDSSPASTSMAMCRSRPRTSTPTTRIG